MKKKVPHTKKCPECGERMKYVTGNPVTGQKHGIPGRKMTYKCVNPRCSVHLDSEIAFKERDYFEYVRRITAAQQHAERELIHVSAKLQRLTDSVNVPSTIAELRDGQRTLEELIKNLKTFVK